MTVRAAAVSDLVPKMSEMEEYGGFSNPRLIYNLGHAAFEFIESKWGKEGVRAYVFALRRSVIGGSDDAYQEAFQVTPEEWDQQFDRYLKERFKPFRDKERPADYGRDLAPDPRKGRFANVLSIEPSRRATDRRHDRQRPRRGNDIVLIPKDGATSATDIGLRPEHGLRVRGDARRAPGRWNSVPWMSWSPAGRSLALFCAHGKGPLADRPERRLEEIEVRIPLPTIDAPESPDSRPTARPSCSPACATAMLRWYRQSRHERGSSTSPGRLR